MTDDDPVRVDDEDVPLAVDTPGGVVVVEGCADALGLVAVDGLLDERLRVGAGLGLGGDGSSCGLGFPLRCDRGGLVPAGSEEVVATPDSPAVLQLLPARLGVDEGVGDPVPGLGGLGEGGAVVEAARIDAHAGGAHELGASGIGNRVDAVVALLQHEYVPGAIDALGGVVVGERGLDPLRFIELQGLFDQPDRVLVGVGG